MPLEILEPNNNGSQKFITFTYESYEDELYIKIIKLMMYVDTRS